MKKLKAKRFEYILLENEVQNNGIGDYKCIF